MGIRHAARVSRGRETVLLASLVLAAGCHADDGDSGDGDELAESESGSEGGETGGEQPLGPDEPMPPLGERPSEQTCRLAGTAASALPRLEAELTQELQASFPKAVQLLAAPAELGDLLVVESDGRIWRVEVDTGTSALLGDLSASVDEGSSRGLLAATLGEGPTQGELFVHYHRAFDPNRTRVSRFDLDLDAQALVLQSEQSVIEIQHESTLASGGALSIDEAGMLLVGVGDDFALPPPSPSSSPARDTLDLRGALLRLDVGGGGSGYAIPADNPFVDVPEGADELFASGLHDPRSCVVDPGGIWCSDAGSGVREEVNGLFPGRDYGWPIVEGLGCTSQVGDCDTSSFEAPHANYALTDPDPSIAHCELRGGLVYRGASLGPLGLDAAFLFGDRCSGRVWGLRTDLGAGVGAGTFEVVGAIADTSGEGEQQAGVLALGADRDGEAWLIDAQGRLARLVLAPGGEPGTLPETLSSSGCFVNPATLELGLELGPDLIPYQVASALWSDGLVKHRHLVVPPGERILVAEDGSWHFPEGSVLIKRFSHESSPGDASTRMPIETRLMVRRNGIWEFHTYRWREDGSDADLLSEGAEQQLSFDDLSPSFTWSFPSETGCRSCHGFGSGRVLGPTTEQLNRDVLYGDAQASQLEDQLAALEAIGLLEFEGGATADPASLPALPDPRDENIPLEQRVRAYFESNCAHCHNPTWLRPDLRYSTTLEDSGLCLAVEFPSPWAPGDFRVLPGDPEGSNVWQRMGMRGDGQMPGLGTARVDPLGHGIVGEWIESLESCP